MIIQLFMVNLLVKEISDFDTDLEGVNWGVLFLTKLKHRS
jgi:hypothetical protein